MPRRVTLAAAGLLLVVAMPSVALAGPGNGGGTGTGGSEEDVLTAAVSYSSDGSGGGGSGDGCTWELADQTISVLNQGSITWPRTDPDTGVVYHLYSKSCPGTGTSYAQVPETEPADLLPLLLEQLKSTRLPRPVPVFTMLDPEFGWAYVRVPLDFRAGEDSWRPVSVTASIGPVWATVTAVPTSLTFEPGDPAGPGAVSCDGDAPTAEYVVEVPGACSYTYVNASSTSPYDGYHFLTSLSIEWSITWTSSTGAGGALDSYSTTTSAELAVAEVKGLVVCTGARPEQGGC